MTDSLRQVTLWFFCSAMIVLAWANPAEAINRDQLPAMHQVAVDYFGPVPCGEVVETFVNAADLAGDDAPLGVRARGGNCRTEMASEVFDASSWSEACTDVVHEYGHSLQDDWDLVAPGIQYHSPDRNSVMYADDTNYAFAPCEQADPTRALEQRCIRAESRRYRASDRTLDARQRLRKLAKAGRSTARASKRVRVWRHAYEQARAEHRSCLTELRTTYGVEV